MTRSLTSKSLPGAMRIMLPLFRMMFKEDGGKSANKASRSTIWAATTPKLDDATGKYFDTKTKERKLHKSAYKEDVQAEILSLIDSVDAKKKAA